MSLPVSGLAEKATVRLISTAYYKPPVLRGLAEDDGALAALEALEGLTNRRLKGQRQGLPDLDPRELAFRARKSALDTWGHTYVNAAFLYTRPTGNRFNDGRRGAWYCAFDDLTAIEEVAYHRTRELAYTECFEDEAVYQALLADFIGDFPDLREVSPPPACLAADPEVGYPAGQALALALREAGHGGVIYPSVRRTGGTCFAAFEPQIVQNTRPGAKWHLVWSGSAEFTVTTPPEAPISPVAAAP